MEQKEKLIEDLEFIKKVVSDSRNIVKENGINFIIWGILIIVGLTVTYFDTVLSGDQYSGETWIIVVSAGWIYSLVEWWKHRKIQRTITFAGKILGSTWLSTGIAMMILGFVAPSFSAYHGVFISPVLATVLGIAFYITSIIYDSKMMQYLVPFWWIGAVVMFVFPGVHTIIIMAGMMLFLQVLPGIIFYRKYNAENK